MSVGKPLRRCKLAKRVSDAEGRFELPAWFHRRDETFNYLAYTVIADDDRGLLRSGPMSRHAAEQEPARSSNGARAAYTFRESDERAGEPVAGATVMRYWDSTINLFQEFFPRPPTPMVDLRSID